MRYLRPYSGAGEKIKTQMRVLFSLMEQKKIPTRDGFGKGLLKLAEKNQNVVALEADLGKSVRTEWMKQKFPERVFNFGISEQDMFVTAAGLASCGKIPFAGTFAIFTERAYEQIRNTIGWGNMNVKVIGSHGGILTGEDGASAQTVEDVAVYRVLPNFIVIVPADAVEAEKSVDVIARHKGPVFMRLTRGGVPVIFDDSYKFEIGKGKVLKEGKDLTIIACGPLVAESLRAAEHLEKNGINARVINMSTIKPLDNDLVLKCAKETGAIVTAEDHSIIGGLGGAVAEFLAENYPVPLERVGVKDKFGESGSPAELYKKYGLTAENIAESAKRVIKRKGKSK